jgi:uncharacterized protein
MRARSPSAVLVTTLLVAVTAAACKKEPAKKPDTTVLGDGGAAAIRDAGPDPAAVLARPYLWEIEKDGKKSYALGTMHLGVDVEKSMPAWVWTRFDTTKAFVMEVDATDPSLIGAVLRSDGSTLEKELGAEHWAKLEGVLGADMAKRFNNLKASAVCVMITLQGLPMTAPMDLVLAQKAKSGNKEIVYLEQARMQQQLVDKWMNTRALKAMLDDVPRVRKNNEELLAAYRSGDDTRLEALLADKSQWEDLGLDDKSAAIAMNELLYDRNRAWIAPLEKQMAAGPVFIGVGVAHLVGDNSVLSLLEKQGYKITRLTGP